MRAWREGATVSAAVTAEPLLLTVDETASLLRTTRKAVYALVERGQLPGVRRLGRRVLVVRTELLEWLCERRTTSPGRNRR
jgi:excisionase family DNA binding protein